MENGGKLMQKNWHLCVHQKNQRAKTIILPLPPHLLAPARCGNYQNRIFNQIIKQISSLSASQNVIKTMRCPTKRYVYPLSSNYTTNTST